MSAARISAPPTATASGRAAHHLGGRPHPGHHQTAAEQLLPQLTQTVPPGKQGPLRRGNGALNRWHLHPQGRCLPHAARRGRSLFALMEKPAASCTAAATAPRSTARSNTGCSPAPRAAANAAARAVAWQALHQRALEVDRIVPRHQGGSDDLSKLQALYFRCNAGKRWEARGGLCVLRAGGQRPGAAGERAVPPPKVDKIHVHS
jgi:hypothetical protein